MKIRLTHCPYWAPVIEDHTGEKGGHYHFDESWLGQIHEIECLKEDNMFLTIKLPTFYEGKSGGWLIVEVVKDCFEVVEK